MWEIEETIQAYEESCETVQQRIGELSGEIAGRNSQHLPLGNLAERRHHLYIELAEMQGAIRQLREYLSNTARND